jgi:hypothetical protein
MTSIPYANREDLKAIIQMGVHEGAVGLVSGILPEECQITGREVVHFRENVALDDGDTVVTAQYTLELLEKLRAEKEKIVEPSIKHTVLVGKPASASLNITEKQNEKIEIFVADAADLYRQLSDRMTELLMSEAEGRAEVTFTGTINGTVTANNLGEIRSIVDLAEGISKAASLLGAVKITGRIFKKVEETPCQ